MQLLPIAQVAELLGFEEQELTTALLYCQPTPIVIRKKQVYVTVEHALENLDYQGIYIPKDPRDAYGGRRNNPPPRLGHSQGVATAEEDDDAINAKEVDAEVVDEEKPQPSPRRVKRRRES